MRVDGEFNPTVFYKTADSTSIQSDNPELYQEFVAVMRHVATKLDASSKLHASYSFIRADGIEVSTEVEHTSTWQDTAFKAFKAFVRSEEIDGVGGCEMAARMRMMRLLWHLRPLIQVWILEIRMAANEADWLLYVLLTSEEPAINIWLMKWRKKS